MKAVTIYSDDIGLKLGTEKCVIQIMMSRKRHITELIELPNQEKIRTLREKYMEILEAVTIKQAEMKEKKTNTSGERGNYSKPNYQAEISSKGSYHGFLPRKILGIILKVGERKTSANRPKNNKTHDDA